MPQGLTQLIAQNFNMIGETRLNSVLDVVKTKIQSHNLKVRVSMLL